MKKILLIALSAIAACAHAQTVSHKAHLTNSTAVTVSDSAKVTALDGRGVQITDPGSLSMANTITLGKEETRATPKSACERNYSVASDVSGRLLFCKDHKWMMDSAAAS